MANPASVGLADDYWPALIQTASAGIALSLDPHKTYDLWHTRRTAAGAAITNSIFVGPLATPATTVPTVSYANTSQTLLIEGVSNAGMPMSIGPGISTIYMRTKLGAPVVQVIPKAHLFGDF